MDAPPRLNSTRTLDKILGTFGLILFVMICGCAITMLAGCATDSGTHPAPAVVYKTVEVKVPIPVRCVDPAQVPVLPPKMGSQLTGQAQHDFDIAAAAAAQYRALLERAVILLGACTK